MTNEELERERYFTTEEDDIEIVSRSQSGLHVSVDVLRRARVRVAAGEDPELVAFDVATEEVALQSRLDNPEDPRMLGGPGSGHFGHSGRPGLVGGSDPGDGDGESNNAAHDLTDRTVDDYKPLRVDGRDTQDRFSDGKGNYTKERAELHQAIVAKYMRGTTAVSDPTATILGGAPASGKSTLVTTEGIGRWNTVQINADDIRNELPEYFVDAEGKRPASTGFTHEEASDISKLLIQVARDGKRNMVLDGTGDTTLQKLGGKIALMRASGHTIIAEYVTTTLETSLVRAEQRANDPKSSSYGRKVPPTAMNEFHRAVSGIFPEAVRQGLFDQARLFDTTGSKHRLVASAKNTALTIYDDDLWKTFLKKVDQ